VTSGCSLILQQKKNLILMGICPYLAVFAEDKYKLWYSSVCVHVALLVCRWDDAGCKLLLGSHRIVVTSCRTRNQTIWWYNMKLCVYSNLGCWSNSFLYCCLWLCMQPPPCCYINCRGYKRTMPRTLNKINILKVDIEVVLLMICISVLQ
jgi:hypothetical protein